MVITLMYVVFSRKHLASVLCSPQIMPKAKAVFDSGKTASYHISTVANCSQSSKNSSLFKLIFARAATNSRKRYDFEAENPKIAGALFYLNITLP